MESAYAILDQLIHDALVECNNRCSVPLANEVTLKIHCNVTAVS